MHSHYRKYQENYCFLIDRTNPAKPNLVHREGTSVQGLKLYTIKSWAPGSVFRARGLEKRKKTKNFESRAKLRRQHGRSARRTLFCYRFSLNQLARRHVTSA